MKNEIKNLLRLLSEYDVSDARWHGAPHPTESGTWIVVRVQWGSLGKKWFSVQDGIVSVMRDRPTGTEFHPARWNTQPLTRTGQLSADIHECWKISSN